MLAIDLITINIITKYIIIKFMVWTDFQPTKRLPRFHYIYHLRVSKQKTYYTMREKYIMYAERLPSIYPIEYYTLKQIDRSQGRLQLLHIIVVFDALKLFLIVFFQLTGSQQWATDWASALTFYKSRRSPVATAGSWIKWERKVWETQSLNRKMTSITVFVTKLPK